jgi:hypothetical protein
MTSRQSASFLEAPISDTVNRIWRHDQRVSPIEEDSYDCAAISREEISSDAAVASGSDTQLLNSSKRRWTRSILVAGA